MTTILAAAAGNPSLIPVLIGAGLSAFISFSIFVLTQFFLFHKSRSDLLRAKLEELWKSVAEVMRRARPFNSIDDSLTPEAVKELRDSANILLESVVLPTPFIALYFPDLNTKYHRVTASCRELVKEMKNPPVSRHQKGAENMNMNMYQAYTDSQKEPGYFKELHEASGVVRTEIGNFLVYLRENQARLIKTPQYVLIDRFEEFSGQ